MSVFDVLLRSESFSIVAIFHSDVEFTQYPGGNHWAMAGLLAEFLAFSMLESE